MSSTRYPTLNASWLVNTPRRLPAMVLSSGCTQEVSRATWSCGEKRCRLWTTAVLPRRSGSSLTVDDEGRPSSIREPDHHRQVGSVGELGQAGLEGLLDPVGVHVHVPHRRVEVGRQLR